MKKRVVAISLIMLVSAVVTCDLSSGQERQLGVNREATAKIRAFDKGFFKDFDVYLAGVKAAPTALLFDLRDDYHLPSRFWESPITEEDIVHVIERLDVQYIDHRDKLRFRPRALNIVNTKGELLGYIYTSLDSILMDRKEDGTVTVHVPSLPTPRPRRPGMRGRW